MVSAFTGPSCRELAARHANADEIERQAVQEATERRAAADAQAALQVDDDIVWVTEDDLNAIVDQGSVLVFTGTDAQGRVVRFGVDHRPAHGLIEAVEAEGTIPCHVEPWQVLSRTSAALV